MKPLYHPSVADITVEGILYALSNPIRAQILARIARSECAQTCSNFLEIDNQKLAKSTLSQHFKILREAGLIRSVRVGVELHNSTRCSELRDTYGTLVNTIIESYTAQTKRHKKKR